MSRPVCYDLIDKVFYEVGKIKQEIESRTQYARVIQELDEVIRSADEYCKYNVEGEDGWVEWNGIRFGNGEWEYAFWEGLMEYTGLASCKTPGWSE
tara:strand:+ start:1148 stop:1435 length:288 start_codon:yes stop_codon:yes gene_type:complete